jgi:hypothetical protein
MRITNPKDFWAGTLYIVFGAGAVLIARSYPFGSATRMGPSYFPTILGVILALLGLLSLFRAFRSDGDPVGSIAWKPLLAITGGTALFAFLLPRAGLPLALAVLILIKRGDQRELQVWMAPSARADVADRVLRHRVRETLRRTPATCRQLVRRIGISHGTVVAPLPRL